MINSTISKNVEHSRRRLASC